MNAGIWGGGIMDDREMAQLPGELGIGKGVMCNQDRFGKDLQTEQAKCIQNNT